MRPFAVIREALDAAQLQALRSEADALAAETPWSLENGCVCEPLSDDPQGAWRVDRVPTSPPVNLTTSIRKGPLRGVAGESRSSTSVRLLVVLFNEHYVVKPPPLPSSSRWHADASLQIPGWKQTCPRYGHAWWISISVTNRTAASSSGITVKKYLSAAAPATSCCWRTTACFVGL